MVFQAYGLFPHMTVAENIAFGPKIKKVARAEIATRVAEVVRTVQLDGMEDRRPAQLSGGQQQRVALARALVNRPAALLLDEPLGALDLKLRKEMQLELKDLQQRTGTTFVYVTHDQEEAMTMSDRIAVMNDGVVEQLATPRELYQRPASAFVAGLHRRVEPDHDARRPPRGRPAGDGPRRRSADPRGRRAEARTRSRTITVRPEWIKLASEAMGERASLVGGTVVDVVYLGSVTQMLVELATGERLTVHRLNDEVGAVEPRPGDRTTLHWAAEHSYVIGGSGNIEADASDRLTAVSPDRAREG